MRRTTRKKIAPMVVTAAVLLYVTPLVAAVLAVAWGMWRVSLTATAFLLLYAVLGGAVIAGVVRALRQRLREIDGGEEEEASQY